MSSTLACQCNENWKGRLVKLAIAEPSRRYLAAKVKVVHKRSLLT